MMHDMVIVTTKRLQKLYDGSPTFRPKLLYWIRTLFTSHEALNFGTQLYLLNG